MMTHLILLKSYLHIKQGRFQCIGADERREMNMAKLKRSTFFKMWKLDFRDLRIKTVSINFDVKKH